MNQPLSILVVAFVVLTSFPAQARFGKKSSSSNDQESAPEKQHQAEAVGSSQSSGSSPSYSPGTGRYARSYRNHHRHSRHGYWSGAFVPSYSYGVFYAAPRSTVIVTEPAEPAEQPEQPQPEPAGVRLSAGIEGQGFRNGVTLGALVGLEGERWGLNASAQNIAVLAEDGSGNLDHLQVATAHLTYALLSGTYGRLRVEGGADAVFAPNLIVIGPTAGLSGTLWIGGPFAIEGSAMVTPWPYLQFDGKVGVALGLGPVGLRAGLRAQALDDRGLVDGVIHQDSFIGPYVGLSLVF